MCGSKLGGLLWRHLTLQRKTTIWEHNYHPSSAQLLLRYLEKLTSLWLLVCTMLFIRAIFGLSMRNFTIDVCAFFVNFFEFSQFSTTISWILWRQLMIEIGTLYCLWNSLLNMTKFCVSGRNEASSNCARPSAHRQLQLCTCQPSSVYNRTATARSEYRSPSRPWSETQSSCHTSFKETPLAACSPMYYV